MSHLPLLFQRKILFLGGLFMLTLLLLTLRSGYVIIGQSEYLSKKAQSIQERERPIKATRGRIIDRNGVILADNKAVCSVSVIHNQISDPQKVVRELSRLLSMSESVVERKVSKYSAIEKIKSNVDKAVGDKIRALHLSGVKVDEDYKRFYPYGTLASKVLGFTGADNQGIIGLESVYDSYLRGKNGQILTVTDASGIELDSFSEKRIEPEAGDDLMVTIDANIQLYATQLAEAALLQKEAKSVSILVMQVETGEILAMVNVPEFDLNAPYKLLDAYALEDTASEKEKNEAYNAMWRNGCINDTYEPGSAFKIITCSAALEEGVVSLDTPFYCPGYIVVKDRKIRCARTQGHGSQNLVEATMNSCNPAYITIGLSLGVDRFFSYFEKFGLLEKTGIDLPGEAKTIMHKKENVGPVELATISFGQSFQITPIQLLTTAAALINDGNRVVPHFAKKVCGQDGEIRAIFEYPIQTGLISQENSEKLRMILEQVVANGGGKSGAVEGFRVGGKTATSQTIPRGNGIYISSFLGFAPADDPKVIAIAIVNAPKGTYYGGMIAAPIIRQLYENILPYLEEKGYTD